MLPYLSGGLHSKCQDKECLKDFDEWKCTGVQQDPDILDGNSAHFSPAFWPLNHARLLSGKTLGFKWEGPTSISSSRWWRLIAKKNNSICLGPCFYYVLISINCSRQWDASLKTWCIRGCANVRMDLHEISVKACLNPFLKHSLR